jgi:hypothetical protein
MIDDGVVPLCADPFDVTAQTVPFANPPSVNVTAYIGALYVTASDTDAVVITANPPDGVVNPATAPYEYV